MPLGFDEAISIHFTVISNLTTYSTMKTLDVLQEKREAIDVC